MGKTMNASDVKVMTEGQIESALSQLRDALRKQRSKISSDIAQQVLGMDNLGMIMAAPFLQRAEAGILLAPRGEIEIVVASPHNPETYYQTRSGLYVWDDFRTRVVTNAKRTAAGSTFKVVCAELTRDMTDKEIEAGLPDHFSETAVCAAIAGLIAKQPNGEDGVLKNNGRANLFYLSSCVVRVYWDADNRKWYVDTWERDDGRWSAGFQVFSPGN